MKSPLTIVAIAAAAGAVLVQAAVLPKLPAQNHLVARAPVQLAEDVLTTASHLGEMHSEALPNTASDSAVFDLERVLDAGSPVHADTAHSNSGASSSEGIASSPEMTLEGVLGEARLSRSNAFHHKILPRRYSPASQARPDRLKPANPLAPYMTNVHVRDAHDASARPLSSADTVPVVHTSPDAALLEIDRLARQSRLPRPTVDHESMPDGAGTSGSVATNAADFKFTSRLDDVATSPASLKLDRQRASVRRQKANRRNAIKGAGTSGGVGTTSGPAGSKPVGRLNEAGSSPTPLQLAKRTRRQEQNAASPAKTKDVEPAHQLRDLTKQELVPIAKPVGRPEEKSKVSTADTESRVEEKPKVPSQSASQQHPEEDVRGQVNSLTRILEKVQGEKKEAWSMVEHKNEVLKMERLYQGKFRLPWKRDYEKNLEREIKQAQAKHTSKDQEVKRIQEKIERLQL